MLPLYPIFLDVSQRLIVIVGGGSVAARKAAGLLAAGGQQIRAVAPAFGGDFPIHVERICQAFSPHHLDGAGLVFAATDSAEVNDAVVAESRRQGIWVNRADVDDDDRGDFAIPALARRGAITLAVATGGSPALAARVRDLLAAHLSDSWAKLADALVEIRPRVKSANLPLARRREIFRALATAEAAAAAMSGGEKGLWTWARGQFAELQNMDHPKSRAASEEKSA